MSAIIQAVTTNDVEIDHAEALLAAHEGDAVAALRHVIAQASFLHGQLLIASTFVSYGAARDGGHGSFGSSASWTRWKLSLCACGSLI